MIPVLADEGFHHPDVLSGKVPIPRWMSRADWLDFRPGTPEADLAEQRLLRTLTTPYLPHKIPFMVDELPGNFVPRPREFDPLIRALVDDAQDAVAISAALRGAGGFGKTTLTRAVCHDLRVRGAFDDGILWVTLGEHPADLTGKLLDLAEMLTGQRPSLTSVEAAQAKLVEALGERYLLMVIDDVWNRAHAEPFLQGGQNCARLLTTRNRDTLPAYIVPVDVDAMQPGEAVALLAAGLPDPDLVALERLARRLGEWPLLLNLVNGALCGYVTEGRTMPDGLAYVDKALTRKGLVAFDRANDNARNAAVAATLAVSLELLSPQELERYARLAIFPEDVDLPLMTLERLWELDDFDTEELCCKFAGLSLLLRFDAVARRARLHDVFRWYLRDQHRDNLVEWNNRFLAKYCAPDQAWTDLPAGEPYLWDHLAYPLREAGRHTELYELLTASPTWLEAKFAACVGDTSYAADLDLAISDFADPLNADRAPTLVQLQAARQVVHARVSHYSDDDLKTLVWLERKQEALSHAWLRSEPEGQFDGLMAIYQAQQQHDRADAALLGSLWPLARSIANEWGRASALRDLAVALAQAGDEPAAEIFYEATEAARNIQDEEWRAEALRNLTVALFQAGDKRAASIFRFGLYFFRA